jgi:hypothetical protein
MVKEKETERKRERERQTQTQTRAVNAKSQYPLPFQEGESVLTNTEHPYDEPIMQYCRRLAKDIPDSERQHIKHFVSLAEFIRWCALIVVTERERERERGREKERERNIEGRERDRDRDRETEGERVRQRQTLIFFSSLFSISLLRVLSFVSSSVSTTSTTNRKRPNKRPMSRDGEQMFRECLAGGRESRLPR